MGKPVNLNRYRKEKARAEKKVRADVNAAKFGQSKANKTVVKLEKDKQRRDLDGHKVDE
ncbi:protein of unknown function [Ruegeria halocynthiae]|uniref:DUF4169 domain-containing protein n=1 Tax=Ruegeria halocynthiae TaxID=985054 RepID=A0A1H2TLH9_9RHOB|nr:DUF4169 family protein [Ruegeria halocynthiae]SDW44712.1 protein of unknown function [Ruegeria halocynthiae]